MSNSSLLRNYRHPIYHQELFSEEIEHIKISGLENSGYQKEFLNSQQKFIINMLKQSFAPIANNHIQILILGSLPGDKSIQEGEYYAHPQNRFWKLIKLIFNSTDFKSYSEKLETLLINQIGLWDVCAQANRKGSMDIAIVEEEPNNLAQFLTDHPQLHTIIFNGQKAHQLFKKHFKRTENHQYYILPSTSPANAQYSLEKLFKEWETILKKD